MPEGVSIERYVNALIAEIKLRGESAGTMQAETVYIGGGTPSLLKPEDIARITAALRKALGLGELREFTLEANPDTLGRELLRGYKELGITRPSIGIQSLHDEALKQLGRTYCSGGALTCLYELKDELTLFDLSFDLLLCLPWQQPAQVVEGIHRLLAFAPDHFSVYALKLEEGTPLAKRLAGSSEALAAEERYAEEMGLVEETLAAEGFVRYEISNFARDGKWSLHNLNYWNCGEYIGLGLNASGHIAGSRWRNHRNMEDYLRAVESGVLPEAESEALTPEQRIFERVMLAMRTRWGLARDAVPPEVWRGLYANALAFNNRLPGLLIIDDAHIAPTSAGMNVEHSLVLKLIETVL